MVMGRGMEEACEVGVRPHTWDPLVLLATGQDSTLRYSSSGIFLPSSTVCRTGKPFLPCNCTHCSSIFPDPPKIFFPRRSASSCLDRPTDRPTDQPTSRPRRPTCAPHAIPTPACMTALYPPPSCRQPRAALPPYGAPRLQRAPSSTSSPALRDLGTASPTMDGSQSGQAANNSSDFVRIQPSSPGQHRVSRLVR